MNQSGPSTVETRPFALDLATPLKTARGDIRRREGVLVGVEREGDGEVVRGVGEATPLPGWTESYEQCREALEDVSVDGRDANLECLPAAAHGYQQAALDAEARGRGVPLAALLAEESSPDGSRIGDGGRIAAAVPVNATVGDGDAEETVAAAERARSAGYDCVKLKVGARALDTDLERVHAVLDAVDVAVRLDANGAWDRETAERAVEAVAPLGVEYVEQPLPAGDLAGLASLRGRGVDVAVDETLASHSPRAVLEAGAADVAVLKPMALGGPGAAAGLARHLLSNGVDPVITTTVDGAVARAAAVHVAATVPEVRPCGLATADLLAEDLVPDPVPVSDGRIAVPSGPGTCGDAFDDLLW
ncbi:MAG: mandelate racemase/muconate lactonizing enzyme family protein [Salinigranum sp.]